MPFVLNNLAPVGNTSRRLNGVGTTTASGAPTVWAYMHPTDTINDVSASGYFNNASDLLRVGDLILALVGAGSGGTLRWGFLAVNANASGVVDTTDDTVITATDTY